jgi:transcription elongation factor Elf1
MKPGQLYPLIKVELTVVLAHRNSGEYRCCTSFVSLARSDDDAEICLRLSDERVLGAVHLVQTIKSINDTSLSDWEGVIGEELNEKRQEDQEKRYEIRDIAEKLESLIQEQDNLAQRDVEPQRVISENIEEEIRSVRREMASVLSSLYQYPRIPYRPPLQNRSRVPATCPACGVQMALKTNRKGQVRYKGVDCPNCKTKLVARPGPDDEPMLEIRAAIDQAVSCPWCSSLLEVKLENIMGANVKTFCDNCKASIQVSRTTKGIVSKILNETHSHPEPAKLDPEFIQMVEAHLPDQPWPSGIHKELANKFGVSNTQVTTAIKELIKQGKFKHQEDGVLYEPTTDLAKPEQDNDGPG